MELDQKKLTKYEWETIEVPLPAKEKEILELVQAGYKDVNIRKNQGMSIFSFMKIDKETNAFHVYLYEMYFKKIIQKLVKKYDFPNISTIKKKVKLKKADIIRIENSNTRLATMKNTIFEFILLSIAGKLGKKFKFCHYYTLYHLVKKNVKNINIYVLDFINNLLEKYEERITISKLVKDSPKFLEKNNILTDFEDKKLYIHQKKLFTFCKDSNPKLILYQAPTGTGKTVSPIGLTQGHKLIFVCAAKHVGLQLAKACISLEIPIAIAFGCTTASDIRLHYYAAKEVVRNRRTGGIFRVDNSVGDKVDIIIADVKSYLPAMRYMLAFNPKEKIIWYWDEPTITLDYTDHIYHPLLEKNWKENEIPNVILSSATLPAMEDILPCIQSFKIRFPNTSVQTISSYDCKKSIPIMRTSGQYVLPHLQYENYEDIQAVVTHLRKCKTLLRHFDLKEITKFILFLEKKKYIPRRLELESFFENPMNIDMLSLKIYYIELLDNCEKNYKEIYDYFQKENTLTQISTIRVTTADAWTITDGPAIFLANNVEKIAEFCLKSAKIHKTALERIFKNLKINDKIQKQIKLLREREALEKEEKANELNKEAKALMSNLRSIQLDSVYIPNSVTHLKKWTETNTDRAFTSDVSEKDVESIINLPIKEIWKILLLMGIGVFTQHDCIAYREIMKKLAENQKLYIIIAGTDYIYGTNYQFCHGYLGKDLRDITQEKIIQAFGRVGRGNVNQIYSLRLRDDGFIDKLLKKAETSPEIDNMNRLFG